MATKLRIDFEEKNKFKVFSKLSVGEFFCPDYDSPTRTLFRKIEVVKHKDLMDKKYNCQNQESGEFDWMTGDSQVIIVNEVNTTFN